MLQETDENMFENAISYVERNHQQFDSSQLLTLYGYYKQATLGPCYVGKPSWYRFEAIKKWNTWLSLGEMSKQDAICQYVQSLNSFKSDWADQKQEGQFTTTGARVSYLRNIQNDDIIDDDKTAFDWLKENNLEKIRLLIDQSNVNAKDENGMTLLHWAADRGLEDMVKCLVSELLADVNAVDEEGQTALHYAASCEHAGVVDILLNCGASVSIQNSSGFFPDQVTENSVIQAALNRK